MSIQKTVETLGLIACIATLAGCTGDTVGEGYAALRVLHLSPDAPAVDVYLDADRRPAFANLAFTEGSMFLDVEAGLHDLRVTPAGAGPSDVVLSVDGAELRDGSSYTAIAFDALDAPIAALLVPDAVSTIPVGRVRARVIHAAVGVGEVDVWSIPTTGDPEPLFQNVDFGGFSDAIDLPPGAHRLGIDVDDDGAPDLRFDLPDLSSGTYVNLVAVTDESGAPFLLAQLPGGITARIDPRTDGPSGDRAEVRVVHLSPDAPNVDVFVDGERAFSDVTFTWGTEYAELPAGPHRFDVSAAGASASDAVLSVDGLALDSGASYTVVAYDRLTAPIAALALEDSYGALAAGQIRVRAIHTAVGVGSVDIVARGPDGTSTPLESDLSFGTAGSYADLPAGAYSLGFDVDADGISDASFDLPGLVSGTVANVFAVTDEGGALFLLAELRDGNALRIDPSTGRRDSGRIRVLHLSPDAPPVDVYANLARRPLVEGLPFGSGTSYATIPAGTYRFDVSAVGSPATSSVLTVDGFDVAPNASYTVVAYDRVSSIRALPLEEDLTGLAPGNIRVRAIHAAPGITQADVLNVPPGGGIAAVLFYDLDFGEVSDYADIPAGAYLIGVDLDNNRVADARFQLPALRGGTGANIFAVADPSSVYLVAQLSDGTVARIDAIP